MTPSILLVGLATSGALWLGAAPSIGRELAQRDGAPGRCRMFVRARPRSRPVDDGLSDFVLLLAVGLLSGLSVSLTCARISRHVSGSVGQSVRAAVHRQRLGQSLLDSFDELASNDPELQRVVPMLRSHVDDGAPIAQDLLDLASAVRDERRRVAETQARRLPVRMLAPLVVCVLPGFLALTVAPVIIDSMQSVRL